MYEFICRFKYYFTGLFQYDVKLNMHIVISFVTAIGINVNDLNVTKVIAKR